MLHELFYHAIKLVFVVFLEHWKFVCREEHLKRADKLTVLCGNSDVK